jgi:predicted N-acetyltransferase YhbS
VENTIIRQVKPEDYRDICTLSTELGYTYPVEKTEQRIRFILENTTDIILIAEAGGKAVGYIHASPYELMYHDPIMNILGFVVTEEKRGSGIGHLLITEIERLAKERGFTGFRLTSGDDRTGAHRFYEKHGYTTKKTSKKYTKNFYKTSE